MLTIADAGPILEDAKLGDSISVNGTYPYHFVHSVSFTIS